MKLFARVVPFQSRGLQLKGFENRQFSTGTYNRKTAGVKTQIEARRKAVEAAARAYADLLAVTVHARPYEWYQFEPIFTDPGDGKEGVRP